MCFIPQGTLYGDIVYHIQITLIIYFGLYLRTKAKTDVDIFNYLKFYCVLPA